MVNVLREWWTIAYPCGLCCGSNFVIRRPLQCETGSSPGFHSSRNSAPLIVPGKPQTPAPEACPTVAFSSFSQPFTDFRICCVVTFNLTLLVQVIFYSANSGSGYWSSGGSSFDFCFFFTGSVFVRTTDLPTGTILKYSVANLEESFCFSQ
jgi:hypothetical protein